MVPVVGFNNGYAAGVVIDANCQVDHSDSTYSNIMPLLALDCNEKRLNGQLLAVCAPAQRAVGTQPRAEAGRPMPWGLVPTARPAP